MNHIFRAFAQRQAILHALNPHRQTSIEEILHQLEWNMEIKELGGISREVVLRRVRQLEKMGKVITLGTRRSPTVVEVPPEIQNADDHELARKVKFT